MNSQPIEEAKDPDLKLSLIAMQRAARRAHEVAAQSGTAIVISDQGVIRLIQQRPGPDRYMSVQEPTPPDAAKS